MIRITGGQFRGRQLACPPGKAIRPTTAFVRESLFNILGQRLQGARVLDLFAGCGIVGFEALSRGAASVEAIEKSGSHCKLLIENAAKLGLDMPAYRVHCQDAFAWLKHATPSAPYDLIFMDPPYALKDALTAITLCLDRHLLHPHGMLIWETGDKQPPNPDNANQIDCRRYGSSSLAFYQYKLL